MNILSNAIQAISGKGIISIKTTMNEKTQQICIAIHDTGHGIKEEIRNKIFDPFFTSKDVGKGTGLGLSISYGIIKDHKGKIEVESIPEKETEFKIYLPIKQ